MRSRFQVSTTLNFASPYQLTQSGYVATAGVSVTQSAGLLVVSFGDISYGIPSDAISGQGGHLTTATDGTFLYIAAHSPVASRYTLRCFDRKSNNPRWTA